MTTENERLERRLLALEGRLGAVEFALIYAVRPALEVAGGLGQPDTWRDALLEAASAYRQHMRTNGFSEEQADHLARHIEGLAGQPVKGSAAPWTPSVVPGGKPG